MTGPHQENPYNATAVRDHSKRIKVRAHRSLWLLTTVLVFMTGNLVSCSIVVAIAHAPVGVNDDPVVSFVILWFAAVMPLSSAAIVVLSATYNRGARLWKSSIALCLGMIVVWIFEVSWTIEGMRDHHRRLIDDIEKKEPWTPLRNPEYESQIRPSIIDRGDFNYATAHWDTAKEKWYWELGVDKR